MREPLTKDSYEFKRMLHMQRKAGINNLGEMSDAQIWQMYLSIYGENHDKSSGYDEEKWDDGTIAMHTKVGSFWVSSLSSPGTDFEIERLKHHICVGKYKKMLDI